MINEIISILLIFNLFNSRNVNANSEVTLLSKFHQHDYKVKFERLELEYYDKETYNKAFVITFKYNRSTAVANITIQTKVNLDKVDEMTIIIQVYKFLSNEYRRFPIRYQVDYCEAFKTDMIGLLQVMTTLGNFSTACIFNKGVTYHAYNFYPKENNFPPLIPNGDYKTEFNVYMENKLLLTIAGYAKKYRPIL